MGGAALFERGEIQSGGLGLGSTGPRLVSISYGGRFLSRLVGRFCSKGASPLIGVTSGQRLSAVHSKHSRTTADQGMAKRS